MLREPPQAASLEERPNKLEAENRKLKRVAGLIVLSVAAFFLMGQAKPAPRIIEVEGLILKDAEGRIRADLKVLDESSTALRLMSANGDVTAVLSTNRSAGSGLGLTHRTSTVFLSAHESPVPALLTSGLMIFDKNSPITPGEEVVNLGNTRVGPRLSIRDSDGFVARLGASELQIPNTGENRKRSAASLVLFGSDGHVLWSAP